jgi:hypothetical protein
MDYEFEKRCILSELKNKNYFSVDKTFPLIHGESGEQAAKEALDKVFYELTLFRDVEMEKLKIKVSIYEEIIKKSNFSVMVLD